MKLSEAIRLGAMLKPQGFGNSSMLSSAKDSCALGAAAQAAGCMCCIDVDTYQELKLAFPILAARVIRPKFNSVVSYGDEETVMGWCWRMNDNRVPRERIADWVETIENQQAAAIADAMIEECVIAR